MAIVEARGELVRGRYGREGWREQEKTSVCTQTRGLCAISGGLGVTWSMLVQSELWRKIRHDLQAIVPPW